MKKRNGLKPSHFQGIHKNDFRVVGDLLTLKFPIYVKDFVDGKIIGEVVGGSVMKYQNTVWLLKYNNQMWQMGNNFTAFQRFCCSIWELFSLDHSVWSNLQLDAVN